MKSIFDFIIQPLGDDYNNEIKVNVFTVYDDDMMRKLIKLGVYGIFTYDIALLNSSLGRNNE